MSFSLDVGAMMTYASQIFNALSPIAGLLGGLSLGFAVIGYIIARLGRVSIGR